MKILGTGLSGLVGSRIVELLKDYEFENLSLETGVDILDKDDVFNRISNSKADIILHMAAKTDVDGCENDKKEDQKILRIQDVLQQEKSWRRKKTAWAVNVSGTKNIAHACEVNNKKIIYISTDFVFDGEKESYSEEDLPNPVNWYAKTKYEGEKVIESLSSPFLIIRLAYPYRARFERNDFFRAMLNRLKNNQPVTAVTDHIFSPTFIDDFSHALDLIFKENPQGIIHVVGSQNLSPYDAALLIAKHFNLDRSLISKTTRKDFFKNRAQRPFKLALKNDKIRKLGIGMKTFEEGLLEIKKQIKN